MTSATFSSENQTFNWQSPEFVAGLVGGSAHDGAALHLPPGDDRDVKTGLCQLMKKET